MNDFLSMRRLWAARPGRWGGLLALLLLVAATPAFGQGGAREDRHAITSTLERYLPIPREGARPPIVDMRPLLPAVGRQTMNDCAAWAFGYAARSYLEAQDQGWKPDGPERIFSPTFIYNQVNEGRDSGSRPLEVLRLLRDQGGAMLATQPYLPGDFTRAPRSRSLEEAGHFRIDGYYFLPDGEAMRQALAEGHILVVGVRTNPVFSSGRYATYDAESHRQGQLQRRPGQPHGFHAMVVCGYSDHRRAFLFMNSWGQQWGEQGYVWVSYDVVDTFNHGESSEQLMDFAVVMIDRREPVVFQGGRYEAVPLDTMQVRAIPRFTGLEADGTPRYDVMVSLVGPESIRQRFQRVTWAFEGPSGGGVSEQPTDPTRDYAALLSTRDRTFEIQAVVETGHGERLIYRADLALPQAVARDVELQRIDSFYRMRRAGDWRMPLWRWTLVPRMSEQDWADLAYIAWEVAPDPVEQRWRPHLASSPRHLTPLPEEPSFRYDAQAPGAPDRAARSRAYPSGIAHQPPRGTAAFHFRDGTVLTFDLPEQAWPGRTDEGIWFEHEARPVGEFAGQAWWYYELRAHYPEAWEAVWQSGSFQVTGLGPEDHILPGTRSAGDAPAALLLGGHAVHSFVAEVRIALAAPEVRAAPHAHYPSVMLEDLLDGAVGHDTQVAHDHVVDLDGTQVGLRYTDRFLGIREGKPVWEFHLWAASLDAATVPTEGVWELPEETEVPVTAFGEAGLERLGVTFSASEGFQAVLREMTFGHAPPGTDLPERLVTAVQPRSPANEAITLLAYAETPGQFDGLEGPLPEDLVHTRLHGPEDRLRQIRRIDYLVPMLGGRRVPVPVIHRALAENRADLEGARLPRPEAGQSLDAVLHLIDGGVMVKRAAVRPFSPQPILPELELEAVTRYLGRTAGGQPAWSLAVRLLGDPAVLADVAERHGALVYEDGTAVPYTGDAAGVIQAVLHRPARITLTVAFDPALQMADRVLTAFALTPAETVIDAPRIGWLTESIQPAVMDPGAVNLWASTQESEEHFAFVVEASQQWLARVRRVTWQVVDERALAGNWEGHTRTEVIDVPADGGLTGFPLKHVAVGEEGLERTIRATLHLTDGSERVLEPLAFGEKLWGQPAPRVVVEEVPHYAVDPATGREQRLVLFSYQGDAERTRRTLRLRYELDGPPVSSGRFGPVSFVWPGHFAEFVVDRPLVPRSAQITQWQTRGFDIARLEEAAPVPGFPERLVAPAPTGLVVERTAGGYQVVPQLMLRTFEGFVAVVYEAADADGAVRTLAPLGLVGDPHERFRCEASGELPARVVMWGLRPEGGRQELARWAATSSGGGHDRSDVRRLN